MVISMKLMIMLPEGLPGACGYRENGRGDREYYRIPVWAGDEY